MQTKTTPYVILGFLAQGGPLSGYEIRKWIGLTVGHFWNESFGQLYPELQRLTKVGWVTTVADAKATRRRARYRITAAGRRELAAWLAQPPQLERVRNELLLKVFFGQEISREHVQTHLRKAAERWRADVAAFAETQRDIITHDAHLSELVYFVATIRHGRWVRAARLRWAEETLELLDLAAKRGSAALLAHIKTLDKALP
ncbi:MAG: PadR family transcriptional regulator [Gemmatimonadaceae bacterium]